MSSRSEPPASVGGAAGGQRVELGVTRLAQSDTGHANGAAAASTQNGSRPERIATDFSAARSRYRVSVEEYVRFLVDGFLIVRGLVGPEEVQELLAHTEDLMCGRVDVPGLEPPPPGASVSRDRAPASPHPYAAPTPGDTRAFPTPSAHSRRARSAHRPRT